MWGFGVLGRPRFHDPVGAGYSRAAKPDDAKKFHGLDGDEVGGRFHPALCHEEQALVVAEVRDRRELRHHARGGLVGRSSNRYKMNEERHHARLHSAEFSNALAQRRQRPALHALPPRLWRRRGIQRSCRRICRTCRSKRWCRARRHLRRAVQAGVARKGWRRTSARRWRVEERGALHGLERDHQSCESAREPEPFCRRAAA